MLSLSPLRDLAPDQQVGLLFLSVFGTLLLLTVAMLLARWRETSLEGPAEAVPSLRRSRSDEFLRDLGATWFGAGVFWLGWSSGTLGATLLCALLSFLALREFITLSPTGRGDHRSLIAAFFVVLPLQYVIVGLRRFDLLTVFIPVYVFALLPVISALSNDPLRFLERNAKIQWGIMVCVFGLSHLAALLFVEFDGFVDKGAFLVFFLVVVVQAGLMGQKQAGRWLRRRPVARHISRSFSWRGWLLGGAVAAVVGALLSWVTPFQPGQALAMGFIAYAAGSLGHFVMQALKRDARVPSWGHRAAVTGAVGLLDRIAALCFAAPVFFHSVRWYFTT